MTLDEVTRLLLFLLQKSLTDPLDELITVHKRTANTLHLITRDARYQIAITKIGEGPSEQVPRGVR